MGGLAEEASSVERALALYYDQEAGDRAGRALDPRRVAARTSFLAALACGAGPAPLRLLEVGTGPGRDAASFVDAGVAAFGVDLSVEHARLACTTGADVVVGSARHLPFADGTFDALWTMSTLMHVPNAAVIDTLRQLRRVLVGGALAAIGVWGGPDVESFSERERYQPPRLFSRRSDDRWQSLLSVLGSVEEFSTWGDRDDDFWYQWAVVRTA